MTGPLPCPLGRLVGWVSTAVTSHQVYVQTISIMPGSEGLISCMFSQNLKGNEILKYQMLCKFRDNWFTSTCLDAVYPLGRYCESEICCVKSADHFCPFVIGSYFSRCHFPFMCFSPSQKYGWLSDVLPAIHMKSTIQRLKLQTLYCVVQLQKLEVIAEIYEGFTQVPFPRHNARHQ